jgi:hypothetical protein
MNGQCYCPAPTEGWQESVASGSGERTTGNSGKLAVRRPSLYCFVGKILGVKIHCSRRLRMRRRRATSDVTVTISGVDAVMRGLISKHRISDRTLGGWMFWYRMGTKVRAVKVCIGLFCGAVSKSSITERTATRHKPCQCTTIRNAAVICLNLPRLNGIAEISEVASSVSSLLSSCRHFSMGPRLRHRR